MPRVMFKTVPNVLSEFTDSMALCPPPGEVLDTLHELASRYLRLSVVGAARVPLKLSDYVRHGSGGTTSSTC
jgi:hypothetical protein